MQAKAQAYSPEIDGLRAIAVLSVVLFHAGVPGFSSGYLGVDIFFVISGFLITRLLVDEVHLSATIDFRGFYARRIRRLLPSMALMLVVTLIAAVLILFPGELPRLAKSATAVVLMVSNLHFMKYAGGYFAPAVDVMPLLHTWSLSVEEQFYLFWPLLVLLTFRGARRLGLNPRLSLLTVFAILSLASLWFWQRHY
ncbi:MAG: acyltransferase, partial [Azonexus sp.]|nr:acyltransferase [Azonexus sp.]